MYIPDQTEAKHIYELMFRCKPEMPCRNPDALGLFVKLGITQQDNLKAFRNFIHCDSTDEKFLQEANQLDSRNAEDSKILLAAKELVSTHGAAISCLFTLTEGEARTMLQNIEQSFSLGALTPPRRIQYAAIREALRNSNSVRLAVIRYLQLVSAK